VLEVTEQLRRYGDAVAATVDAVNAADVVPVATQPTRPRRPAWRPLVVAATAVVLLAGGVWFATRSSDSSPPALTSETPRPTTATTTAVGSSEGIELLDPGPLAARADAAVAWTGEELVVWGGDIEAFNQGLPGPDRQFGDGAAYDPATRRWRTMSDGPLPTNDQTPRAVATAQGVVIARGTDVALWNPKTNSWRKLDDAPSAVSDLTFTGTEVMSAGANAALDLNAGRWQSFPEPPLTLERPVAEWTGTELVVVGQRAFYTPGALAFDPARRAWRELAAPATLNPAALAADRDGDRVIFVDYEGHVAAYRNDGGNDDWQVLPSVPARFSESWPTLMSVPPAIVVIAGGAVIIRGTNDVWTPVQEGALRFWGEAAVVAPAGGSRERASLFVFGITPEGENRFALVDPERLAETARTLQVGIATVKLPAGAKLTRSAYDTQGGDRVLVELSTPTGSCTVTSTNVAYTGAEPTVGSWTLSGGTWNAHATSTDRVAVTCADAATAKEIVDATKLPTPP